jgi:tRNA G10  N-methylase Trm11
MVPTLLQGHCLDWIPKLKPASVDLILADLPYGKSRQSHHQHISTLDEMIPLDQMWECFRHVIKPAGCIVMTATEPFASMLVVSNLDWCRYDMIWLDVNQPMPAHQQIVVFSANGKMERGRTTLK